MLESKPGINDDQVLVLATSEGRIVVTEDRDFGHLVVRLKRPCVGLVFAYVGQFPGTVGEIASAVADRIDALGETCRGALTVIEPARVRQRPLP